MPSGVVTFAQNPLLRSTFGRMRRTKGGRLTRLHNDIPSHGGDNAVEMHAQNFIKMFAGCTYMELLEAPGVKATKMQFWLEEREEFLRTLD